MKNLRTVIGMAAIFASLFLFLGAFAMASGADLTPGQKLFEAKCSQCHGKDAKGVVKMAKVLKVDPSAVDLTGANASKLSAADMELTVTNGKKKMPKFKGRLTADQIKAVVEYARSLQGGSPETPVKEGKKQRKKKK